MTVSRWTAVRYFIPTISRRQDARLMGASPSSDFFDVAALVLQRQFGVS